MRTPILSIMLNFSFAFLSASIRLQQQMFLILIKCYELTTPPHFKLMPGIFILNSLLSVYCYHRLTIVKHFPFNVSGPHLQKKICMNFGAEFGRTAKF